MLFLRRAHSPFIKNTPKKNNNNNDVNIELGITVRLKALCMMQKKNEINKLCVNKQRQSMKIKSIFRNQWQKKEALCKQTALVKAANSIK